MKSLFLYFLFVGVAYGATKSPPCGNNNISSVKDIVDACFCFLESHKCEGDRWGHHYHFYRPSLEKYSPNQWLWDSCAHQIAWSHKNPENSIAAMRSLLTFQETDGVMKGHIPEMTFWGDTSFEARELDKFMWKSEQACPLTQMPLIPFALRAIYNATKNLTLLKEFVPKAVAYQQWWAKTRDPDQDGLVSIIHGWESGLDASPLYDLAYGITKPKPSYEALYPKFEELVLTYRAKYGWNQTEILYESRKKKHDNTFFQTFWQVEDVGVNAVYAKGWGILADLASIYDPILENECRGKQFFHENAVLKCWNSKLSRFVSFYTAPDGSEKDVEIQVETVQSLFPLMMDNLPKAFANSIVNSQLMNTSKFWLNFPIPSVSKDSPSFIPAFTVDLMWRGPSWPILNFLVSEGLMTHGYSTEANQLMDRWIELYKQSGIWEQYNPEDGSPYGAIGLGMSTLIVDVLYRLGRI